MAYNSRKKNKTYGIYYPYQEGGSIDPTAVSPAQSPEQEAQAFLEAFAQLSNEAQQIVLQQLTQQ